MEVVAITQAQVQVTTEATAMATERSTEVVIIEGVAMTAINTCLNPLKRRTT